MAGSSVAVALIAAALRGYGVLPTTARWSAEAVASLANLTGIKAGTLLPGHGEPWTEGVEEAIRQARAAGPS